MSTHPDIEHMERTGERPLTWDRVRQEREAEQAAQGEYVITIKVVGAGVNAEQFAEAVEEAIDFAGFSVSRVVCEAEHNSY